MVAATISSARLTRENSSASPMPSAMKGQSRNQKTRADVLRVGDQEEYRGQKTVTSRTGTQTQQAKRREQEQGSDLPAQLTADGDHPK